jgi:hypothetical protein
MEALCAISFYKIDSPPYKGDYIILPHFKF